ncbi:RING-H2 zinc finger domain-containing protein [Phthorimaea operculella]|nr:RING-H2 zinc finger domain-containing protein [Phthorimaea operculella]
MSGQGGRCGTKKMGDSNDGSSESFAMWALGGLAIPGAIAAWVAMRDEETRPTVTLVQERHRPMVSRTFFERDFTGDICAICHEPLCSSCAPVQQEIVQLSCGHVFHAACVGKLLQQQASCPECKSPIQGSRAVTEKCDEKSTQ